jgi:alpha-L-rhamnosidase
MKKSYQTTPVRCAQNLFSAIAGILVAIGTNVSAGDLDQGFVYPPASAKPWVYWYFMDGNLTREGMTADLEAMKKAGIGGAIFLEVDIGIPRGPVHFMSPEWQELLVHAIHEADLQGIQIALGSGAGWCGTGGPWLKPEQTMQHLVASERFDVPAQIATHEQKCFLDFGNVKNLARVKLNGQDLGVVWCAPWRLDVTGIVRAGTNQIEIEVANLWPNRLIGDADLPRGRQLTWTTYNPYKVSSPLLPSGLIGPVTLEVSESP